MNYYHHTSRDSAQSIICCGELRPGLSGRIYLTPTAYADGHLAANELSITGKPVELRLEIDHLRVTAPSRRVRPIRDGLGRIVRRGGGLETTWAHNIKVANPGKWHSLTEP